MSNKQSKREAKQAVETLNVESVEFTDGGATITENPAIDLTGLGEGLASMDSLEKGEAMPRLELPKFEGRNALFNSAADAVQAFKNWEGNYEDMVKFMRLAVQQCLVLYAMDAQAERRNAQPLTNAVYAMNRKTKFGHRSRDLAAKLINWVQGCSNLRWRKDKTTGVERFVVHTKLGMNTEFSDAQRTVYDTPFDLYTKPVKKTAFDLASSLKRLLDKAEREGMSQEERAKVIANVKTGNAPTPILVPNPERQEAPANPGAPKATVDTAANTAEAA